MNLIIKYKLNPIIKMVKEIWFIDHINIIKAKYIIIEIISAYKIGLSLTTAFKNTDAGSVKDLKIKPGIENKIYLTLTTWS